MVFIAYYAVKRRKSITFQKLGHFLNSAPPKAVSVDPPLMTFPTSVEIYTKKGVWDVIPSYPTAVHPCSLALAALPVTRVSAERLFSAMRLLLSDLRSRLKQDAVKAMLLLRTNMI